VAVGHAVRAVYMYTGMAYVAAELEIEKTPVRIKAVPYYAWNNRGEGEMYVWIRQMGL